MPRQLSAPQQAARNLGGAIRHRDPDAIAAARVDLRMAVAEDYIRKLTDEAAPPLSAEQRARLAAILLEPAGNGDAS